MFKFSKKLILMSIFSLCWSHIECAEGEAERINSQAQKALEQSENLKTELAKNRQKNFIDQMKIKHELTDKSSEEDVNNAYKQELRSFYKGEGLFNSKSEQNSFNSIDNYDKYREAHLAEIRAAKKEAMDRKEAGRQEEMKELTKKFQDKVTSLEDLEKLSGDGLLDIFKNPITNLRTERFNPEEFKKIINQKLLSLNPNDFTQVNPSFIKILSKETITNLSIEQIKALTTDQVEILNKDQIKALFSRSDLAGALIPDQVRAINPKILADAIEGSLKSKALQFNPFGKKDKIQTLPDSFVDALTPEQTKAILDVHEKAWFSHLKDYFTDAQIKKLKNTAQASESVSTGGIKKEEAQARNIVIDLAENTQLLNYNNLKFKNLMQDLSIPEKENIANEFTKKITEEESKYFANKSKITELKEELQSFIDNYINPTLNKNEIAFLNSKGKIQILNTTALTDSDIAALIDSDIAALTDEAIEKINSSTDLSGAFYPKLNKLTDEQLKNILNNSKSSVLKSFIAERFKRLPSSIESNNSSTSGFDLMSDTASNSSFSNESLDMKETPYVNEPSYFKNLTPTDISQLTNTDISKFTNENLDELSNASLLALENKLKELPTDSLSNILNNSKSSNLHTVIYKIKPELGAMTIVQPNESQSLK